jgi:non-homologous end joining protein Ku
MISDELSHPQVGKDEVRLATKLIEASTATNFDLAAYEDVTTKQLRQLIEAKMDEEETVSSPATGKKSPPVINLMDALRRSVSQARRQPGHKPAATTKAKHTPRRRAKTRRSAG